MSSRIEGIVARLHGLHPRLIDLSLDRLRVLLEKLDHPERRLPPVVHVAGTNGKGSTCAFVRAMAEAAGQRVHVYTSPHLVRFNERIRVAGELVSDAALAAALEHVEQVNAGDAITVFEVITAVAFHLFAQTQADLCVLEVGLGGRGDATNVIDRPAACAITSISLDHREMLGDTLPLIAAEKAGIMKPGVPVVIGLQPQEVADVLLTAAQRVGAPVILRDRDWRIAPGRYDDALGVLDLPPPSLPGAFQLDNAGIAIAAMRASGLRMDVAGVARAEWPARLQRLHGRLAALLPADWELWLDGGHNPGAGVALAEHLRTWSDRPVHVVVGMKQTKDATEFLRPLVPFATTLWAVAEPGQHDARPVEAIIEASGGVARPGPHVADALRALPRRSARAGADLRQSLPGRRGAEAGCLMPNRLLRRFARRNGTGSGTTPSPVLNCRGRQGAKRPMNDAANRPATQGKGLAKSAGALAGLKVIDLTRVLGGPYCTMILSDHGAEVIKIEPPQGDEVRDWGPPFHENDASYFIGINRNKRAIALDIGKPEGRGGTAAPAGRRRHPDRELQAGLDGEMGDRLRHAVASVSRA